MLYLESLLSEACASVVTRISPLAHEYVPLNQALDRTSAISIIADRPSPSFAQSTRDGFAVATQPLFFEQSFAVFQVIGETAAGCTEQKSLGSGQAIRIMTGAMLPSGCARVIPFEVCQERDGRIFTPLKELSRELIHIRHQGQDIQIGQLLVAAKTQLLPDHLLLLAENGCQNIAVSRQPRVAVICTGSELVKAGEVVQLGQKISSNNVLLTALLQTENCLCVRTVTADDNAKRTAVLIRQIIERDQPDILISTGGMGPGKFDLTEQVFALLDGELLCNRLRVRPGKSTLVGMLGNLPFFGLPGPPPAVRLLFHELVVPALRRLQGTADSGELLKAIFENPLGFRQSNTDDLILKGGVAWIDAEGQLRVRLSTRLEPINAIMHLSEPEGKQIKIRLISPL